MATGTLTLRAPRLFVLRMSVTDTTATTRRSWCMPAAPFGASAWQLPTVAAYLTALNRTQGAPTLEKFAAHLSLRAGGSVPVPLEPYAYDPMHDPRVSTWVDVHTEPAQGGERWARCALSVLEQETGRCGWSRITRRRGAHEVIAHAYQEATAEAELLAGRMRTRPNYGTAEVHELAEQMRAWCWRAHRQARAEQLLIRAGKPSQEKQKNRRSIALTFH
ncbi:hypothetical protein ACFYY2_31580 [Streptomyces sp. NPDC001822]|uniref:hypothetical protein n=1 Tax=Streptomyces sp. NPDC001822 TaxID=3364614 RepID=UPI00367AB3F3